MGGGCSVYLTDIVLPSFFFSPRAGGVRILAKESLCTRPFLAMEVYIGYWCPVAGCVPHAPGLRDLKYQSFGLLVNVYIRAIAGPVVNKSLIRSPAESLGGGSLVK